MQTNFSAEQRKDPDIAASEEVLRKCVHCGFCTATCPTYLLLGDELDSPRGRIYLIKDMLEHDRPATPDVVRHVDRCLSCLACMTTCPSGVNYQHLIDHARAHVERTYKRPWVDRGLRALLAFVMPHPGRFRIVLRLAALARPFSRLLPPRLRAMLALVSAAAPSRAPVAETQVPSDSKHKRVAVLTGCVQAVLGEAINAATLRVLDRAGVEPVLVDGCCGSIVHHLGRDDSGRAFAGRLIERLHAELTSGGLDAIVINASGCGTHLKDFGFIFRDDESLSAKAATVSNLTRDITEFLIEHGLPAVVTNPKLKVAYHSACSMQHGQQIVDAPLELLRAAGFEVVEIPEGHLCCGSAGTYNMLQPELAGRLLERKLVNIATTEADVIAAGNLGCLTQIGSAAQVPVVHTVELLDWVTGGEVPRELQ